MWARDAAEAEGGIRLSQDPSEKPDQFPQKLVLEQRVWHHSEILLPMCDLGPEAGALPESLREIQTCRSQQTCIFTRSPGLS